MKTRAALLMSCLLAAPLVHASTPIPSDEQELRRQDERTPSHARNELYPVDLGGGPRGSTVRRHSVSAQLTTTPLPTWTFESGTSGTDQATAVATCGGYVYAVGYTNSTLPGQPQLNAGGMDVFITKHKASTGALIWTEQFGSPMDDLATGIAVTGCAGGVASIYVTGYTKGTLPGATHTGTNQGGYDVFVRKYNDSKVLQWSRERGSNKDDLAYSIAVNDTTGDVYITGYTLGSFVTGVTASSNDVFVARYLSNGSAPSVSAIQFGSAPAKSDFARGITVDRDGKVYVTGYTNGAFLPPTSTTNLGGNDIYLAKYSADLATREWIRQVGTSSADYVYGVAASKNAAGAIEIYVVGQSFGSLTDGGTLGANSTLINAGDYDAVIFQFSDTGTKLRATLNGTQGRDSVTAVASDGGANVYVVGTTTHDIQSDPGAFVGSVDAYLMKYDVSLNLKSVHQYGSTSDNPDSEDDTATGVAADKDNGVYLSGFSQGNIGTSINQGGNDFFVMRYSDGCSVDPSLVEQCRSGSGWGDPHLGTADRYNYDFQGVGEFILVESLPAAPQPMAVQVRQRGDSTVAAYAAVAARFGTDRVGIYARATNLLMVNGAPVSLAVDDVLPLADGTRVLRPTSSRYIIASAQGDRVFADTNTSFLNLTLTLAPSRASQVRGLLGNFNNVRADDFALRDGTPLTPPLSFSQLYTSATNFAESWRITQAESLFDYAQGESTSTFTNRSLPTAPATRANLTPAQQQAAQQTCQAAGVTDAQVLDGCILDVGLTGDGSFATGSAQAQAQQPIAQQAYLGSFDEQTGTEWDTGVTNVTPTGDRIFLGEFSNESAQLTLPQLPAHSTVTVTFDLLILQAWDGNGPFGPNSWGMKADGTEVYRTTFSNTSSPQFYPDQVNGPAHPAGTGAVGLNTLFYPDGDAIYQMSITFEHTSPQLALQFFADGLPGITNETWGIDNVEIKVK